MTDAPDPGLTDLIAAHRMELDFFRVDCVCGESFGSESQWYAHFGAVVEQHTNGRTAELGWDELVVAIPDGWELRESAQLEEVSRVRQRDLEASQATTARWRARADKAEAAIARVEKALAEGPLHRIDFPSAKDPYGIDRQMIRAALEGEQQ